MPDEWAWFAVVAFIFPTNESAESVWLGPCNLLPLGLPAIWGAFTVPPSEKLAREDADSKHA